MKKTYIFAFAAIFCWSTVSVTSKLLLNSYNNFQVLWISSFFAAVFLLILNLASGNLKKLKQYKLKDYIKSILIGIPGSLLYYVFYYAGADMLPASQAFIINYLWPIMSVIFACIILKQAMTIRKVIAIIVSFIGVIVVVGGNLESVNKNVIIGAILCVMAAVSYGLFTSLYQKVYYDKRISMMLNFTVTFVLTSIINVVNNDFFVPNISSGLGFVWNGVFAIAIADTSWALALESGETAKISNLAYITPFASLIWTSLILENEKLHLNFVIGLVIIMIGIFVQLKDKSNPDSNKNNCRRTV